jgi:Fe-Mn family superoxide dismutase
MAFTLPDLKYSFDYLEPVIDAKTMEIHHGKHHAAYVNNLNNALSGTEWENKPIEVILQNIDTVPDNIRTAVRNNGEGMQTIPFSGQFSTKTAEDCRAAGLRMILQKNSDLLTHSKMNFQKLQPQGSGQAGHGL